MSKRKAETSEAGVEKKLKSITDFFPKTTAEELQKSTEKLDGEQNQKPFIYKPSPPKSQRAKGDIWRNKQGKWKFWDGKLYRELCEECKQTRANYGTIGVNGTNSKKWCKRCAEEKHADEYVDFNAKCEECQKAQPNYGTIRADGAHWKRWCKRCAEEKHADEYVDFQAKCEECKKKVPNYGIIRGDGTHWRRWCKPCAEEKHADECVDCQAKCEECKKTRPHYGIIRENGTHWTRWCKTCAEEKHADEYIDFNVKCEDCKKTQPNYGTIRVNGAHWKRWCKSCAEAKHADEYIDFQAKCEECKQKGPHYGIIRGDGTHWRRWCKPCAEEKHADEYVNLQAKCKMGCGKYPVKDAYCTTCHPDYIPAMTGASKQACEFIDELERQLKVTIQHKHYDKINLSVKGDEKKIEGTYYRFDGFVLEGKLPFISRENGCGVEFHGVHVHGYPNNEHKDDINFQGKTYGELYEKTMKREQEIRELGYTIIRIFSTQYEEWKKHRVGSSLLSYCTVI